MSILIKGMEMPHNCEECGLTSHRPEGLGLCHILHKQCNYDTRPKDCPLVEVSTPHGRLIDADAFEAIFYEDAKNEMQAPVYVLVDRTPTVIEAEEKDVNVTD